MASNEMNPSEEPPPYTQQPPVTAQPGDQPQPGSLAQPGYPTQPGYPAQPGYQPQPGYPAQPGQPPQSGYPPQYGYPPAPTQQVQQTTTVVNVGAPAGPTIIMPMVPPPPNWLALSIFTIFCCNLPLGIAALVFGIMVDSSYAAGDHDGAWRNSNIAKWINIISIALTVLIVMTVIIIVIASTN